MKELEVQKSGNAKSIRVSIDDIRLQFTGDKATKNLPEGKHRMSWSVLGSPGQTYKVVITKPAGIACKGEGTLDVEGIDFGACPFTL